MCIPRTTLTRHHSLISSFVSCPVCFPCSFAPCYEVLMTPEPSEEFRYSGYGTSLHGLQPIVLCLWHNDSCHLTLNCSSALRLELSVSVSKFGLGQALWNFLDPARTGEEHHSARSQGCLE